MLIAVLLFVALYFVSFHPLNYFPCGWLVLTPLLVALRGIDWKRRLRCGLLAGFLAHAALNYWVAVTVFNARWLFDWSGGQAFFFAMLAWLLTALVLSVYVSVFCALMPHEPSLTGSRLAAHGSRFIGCLTVACWWTILEFIRSWGALGYPWGVLGYSQWRVLPMIQSAEFASVYGVSFLMAFVGAGAAVAFTGRKWLPLGVGIGAVVLCGVWGQARCANLAQQGQREESPVTIIQGNIPNEAKVNKQRARENIALYERLTSSAVKSRQPSLIVWPETVILLAWSRFPDVQQSLRNNVRAWNAGLVTGSLEQDEQKRLYNVALSLSPRGDVMGVYQKTHLVPFSEYVPMKWFPPFRLLKFLEPEFQAGDAVRLLPTDVGNVGVMICFEAMFPDISRALAQSGAVFLTSMTNDDWSRGTSAPADLAAMSVFRAVETRRWIVRAANTGISCFIDERGRMVARSAWGERETLTQKVVHHAPQTGETFYVRYGNWFIYLCGIVCVTTTAAQFLCRRVEHVRKNERPTGLEQ